MRKAITLLMANEISQLPVIEGGSQVGCVTEQALLVLDGEEPHGILTLSDAVQYLLKH